MAAIRQYPDAAAISGRTTYADTGLLSRIPTLLTRSYFDPGSAGETRFISNNNAVWRKSVFLAHPLPVELGAFASRMQSEAVLRTGGRFLFDPAIQVIHEYEGWKMEADIRKNSGYGTVITRLHDAQVPYAQLIRLGWLSIPAIVAGKTVNSWRDCFRCWRQYGVRFHELPIAVLLGSVLTMMEVPGMWAAFRNGQLSATAYR